MALEQMEGFELAGRVVSTRSLFVSKGIAHPSQLRVNTVHEKGTVRYTQQDTLEESGGKGLLHTASCRCILCVLMSFAGGNLNAASRQALMQKLARTQSTPVPESV